MRTELISFIFVILLESHSNIFCFGRVLSPELFKPRFAQVALNESFASDGGTVPVTSFVPSVVSRSDLTALPDVAMGTATSTSSIISSKTTSTVLNPSAAATGTYSLAQANRGANFFSNNNWDFWNITDPTHGTVVYVDQTTAQKQGLIGITSKGRAFVQTSSADLPLGQKRPSVRFNTKQSFDSGIVIFDVVKMPVGCATWPALWTVNGVNWPLNGEIDVMEGIGYTNNKKNSNLMSVHLNGSSALTSSSKSYSGSLNSNNCLTSYGLGNTGCSFYDKNGAGPSWGSDFNAQNGGIWAMQFGKGGGVKIWFWGRHSNKIPKELSNRSSASATLKPSLWGVPVANFQSPLIDSQIKGQQVVLDITIGGDWAGNVAMDGKCGTNYKTALAKGSNYASAKFILNGIDIYCLNGVC